MKKHGCNGQILFSLCGLEEILWKSFWKHWGNFNHICLDWSLGGPPEKLVNFFFFYKKKHGWSGFNLFSLYGLEEILLIFFSLKHLRQIWPFFGDFFRLCKLEEILWKSSHKPLGWFLKWMTSLTYYYYVYITMIVYFLTDVMKWLRGKWDQLMKLVIPVWSSIDQDFCVPSMDNREFKFGYQHFLLCQKSFLKVSSKWLLKNKSDNGKLLLGKTYSGERFRAILALLFNNLNTFCNKFYTCTCKM